MASEPALTPPEPRQRGFCAWCGHEVYEGNDIFTRAGQLVHRECMGPLACEALDPAELAALCGYREELA